MRTTFQTQEQRQRNTAIQNRTDEELARLTAIAQQMLLGNLDVWAVETAISVISQAAQESANRQSR